jgi:hemerythrin-like metal-binding protein
MTLLIPWKHTSNVGVRAMDDQHAIIMDALNELRLGLVHSDNRASVDLLLVRIVEFTRLHFLCEERLMEQHGFPGLEGHRAEHQRLLAQLQETIQRMKRGEGAETSSLLAFLHDWFIDHVEYMDKQYGPWLNKQNLH